MGGSETTSWVGAKQSSPKTAGCRVKDKNRTPINPSVTLHITSAILYDIHTPMCPSLLHSSTPCMSSTCSYCTRAYSPSTPCAARPPRDAVFAPRIAWVAAKASSTLPKIIMNGPGARLSSILEIMWPCVRECATLRTGRHHTGSHTHLKRRVESARRGRHGNSAHQPEVGGCRGCALGPLMAAPVGAGLALGQARGTAFRGGPLFQPRASRRDPLGPFLGTRCVQIVVGFG